MKTDKFAFFFFHPETARKSTTYYYAHPWPDLEEIELKNYILRDFFRAGLRFCSNHF